MTHTPLYPFSFEPVFQYRLWGGRALGDFMHKGLPGQDPIGEAWILSDRDDCASRIANGPLAGSSLTDLMRERREEVLGRQAGRFERFPLLLKFLDVEQMLSVQVHPRDDQSDLIPKGDTGKTEAWVVLDAGPKAKIYAGLEPGTTAGDLRSLSADTADEHLAGFQPHEGQAVLIEAGTVHSIGGGLTVFEVQENSDVTFRLYDWDHVDAKTGKPRPLQVDEALASVDFDRGPVRPVRPRVHTSDPARAETLIQDPHFELARWRSTRPFPVGASGEARILVCVEGSGEVAAGAHSQSMTRGDVILMPAAVGVGGFTPRGAATVLEIGVPEA